MILLFQLRRGSGGIGRRTRLRIWRLTAWGFKSLLPHQLYCTFRGAIFFCLKLGVCNRYNYKHNYNYNYEHNYYRYLLLYIKRSRSLITSLYVIINELELFN